MNIEWNRDKNILNNKSICLTSKQWIFLKEILKNRKSFFLSGAAGTGKSFIVQIISELIRFNKININVALTASTGIAACNIGGQTIHSWAGITLKNSNDPVDVLCHSISKNKEAANRWITTDLLIIDEISMISAELFDKLSAVGSYIRKNNQPFGGLQIITCGDFLQLPPVNEKHKLKSSYAFSSDSWFKLYENNRNVIILDHIFRQEDDTFLQILNELRLGIISNKTEEILNSKVLQSISKYEYENNNISNNITDGNYVEKRTKLFSLIADVATENDIELNKLTGVEKVFKSKDLGNKSLLTGK
jgi:ATP-dependent DNA helicase PIF1